VQFSLSGNSLERLFIFRLDVFVKFSGFKICLNLVFVVFKDIQKSLKDKWFLLSGSL
jgi:hypothetical protein